MGGKLGDNVGDIISTSSSLISSMVRGSFVNLGVRDLKAYFRVNGCGLGFIRFCTSSGRLKVIRGGASSWSESGSRSQSLHSSPVYKK